MVSSIPSGTSLVRGNASVGGDLSVGRAIVFPDGTVQTTGGATLDIVTVSKTTQSSGGNFVSAQVNCPLGRSAINGGYQWAPGAFSVDPVPLNDFVVLANLSGGSNGSVWFVKLAQRNGSQIAGQLKIEATCVLRSSVN